MDDDTDELEPQRIYFIQAGSHGPIKIGLARNPHRRLRKLQVGCPWRLYLIGYILGGWEKEKSLHEKFAHLKKRGEWFNPGLELLAFIKSVRWGENTERPPLPKPECEISAAPALETPTAQAPIKEEVESDHEVIAGEGEGEAGVAEEAAANGWLMSLPPEEQARIMAEADLRPKIRRSAKKHYGLVREFANIVGGKEWALRKMFEVKADADLREDEKAEQSRHSRMLMRTYGPKKKA